MVELSFPFKINMEAFLDTDLHFHRSDRCFFDGIIGKKDGKIEFFSESGFHISGEGTSDKISDSAGDTVESFILFFEVGELELEGFAFGEDSCGLKFFGGSVELSAEIFIRVNF
jgi:hypothetical protein